MSDAVQTETWEILKEFGFKPDSEVWSDIQPGLAFDFGSFNLTAGATASLNPELFQQPVVLFLGNLITPRTMAQIQFELPRQVDCPEQCAAFIVYHLRSYLDDILRPTHPAPWVETGKDNQILIPKVARLEAYKARPVCFMDREFARPLLKKLRECVKELPEDALVSFSYDGEILRIRAGEHLFAGAAAGEPWDDAETKTGKPWDQIYSLKAGVELPTRLMRPKVEFSYFDGKFTLADYAYLDVIVQPLEATS